MYAHDRWMSTIKLFNCSYIYNKKPSVFLWHTTIEKPTVNTNPVYNLACNNSNFWHLDKNIKNLKFQVLLTCTFRLVCTYLHSTFIHLSPVKYLWKHSLFYCLDHFLIQHFKIPLFSSQLIFIHWYFKSAPAKRTNLETSEVITVFWTS